MVSLYGTSADAQWLPPVNFSTDSNVCDSTPWKLVFYDDFDGTALNNTKWVKFNHWNGFESDNWSEGRVPYPGNYTVIQDENVVVSGGTVKLKVKQKTTTWQCDTCIMTPYTQNYTSGYISTRYSNAFNSGRIEARLKMPLFKWSWGTCWTWGTRINEIDFAESWGGTGGHPWPYIGDRPRNTYNLHAWAPETNPLGLPDHVSINNTYPNQSWWNWITGNRHHQEDWHTYICEWDTASIKIYLDGTLINTIWKYYRNQPVDYYDGNNWVLYNIKVPSGCHLSAGTWNITEGYPYSNNSESKIVFSVGMTNPDKVLSSDGALGQMEIDYVKVYQRYPELEGRTEIGNALIPNITVPSTLCGTNTYNTSPVTSGSVWSTSKGAVTFEGDTSGGSNVWASNNPDFPYTSAILSHTYTPDGCPPATISGTTNSGTIRANVFVLRNRFPWKQNFSLWVDPVIPGTTYNWKVWYGFSSFALNYYTATGPYITTPKMWHGGIFPYIIRWELNITTPSGSKTLKGGKNNLPYIVPIVAKPETFMETDSSTFYLETRFTEEDSMHYEQKVSDIIAAKFVENPDDTVAVTEMIGKIRMEAIEPYLYFGTEEDYVPAMTKFLIDTNSIDSGLSEIFPASASQTLTENFSEKFDAHRQVPFKIYNELGLGHLLKRNGNR